MNYDLGIGLVSNLYRFKTVINDEGIIIKIGKNQHKNKNVE
jgi:hypothetical protein